MRGAPIPQAADGSAERSATAATAILVTFGSADVVDSALASLPPGVRAIVVDNGSTDESAAIAERRGATVIRRSDNAGFGVANNIGVEAADTAYVLLLNPDAALRVGCLETLLAAAEAHPDAVLLVPTIVRDDGSRFEKWSTPITAPAFRPKPAGGGVRDIAFASGAVVLARRDRLLEIGGFDPAIFLYFEDDDLSRRVLDRGWRILHVTSAEAEHVGNVSTPPSPAMTRAKHAHLAWSELYVRRKHALPRYGLWRIVECAVKWAWAAARRDRFEQAKQRGLIKGTIAGLRGWDASAVGMPS
jgi:N-acetylglucosaminyl-diphospho-decaprenol L-rhamnosyltransferase